MSFDQIKVLRYVQKEMDARELEIFERELAENAEMARAVEAMQASILPYETAFHSDRLTPLPSSVEQLLEVEAATQSSDRELPSSFEPWFTKKSMAICAVIACVSFFLGSVFNEFNKKAIENGVVTSGQSASEHDSGLEFMAIYQALYARETVEKLAQPSSEARALLEQFSKEFGQDLELPKLEEIGLVFKRAQVLRYQDEPIIQMVYLGAEGLPIAVCAFKTGSMPNGLNYSQSIRITGMIVHPVRKENVAYVMMIPDEGNSVDLAIQSFERLI